MRFQEAYESWQARRLSQDEAAQLLGMCGRSFRRYVARHEADGPEGLLDRRISQASARRAPVDEVVRMVELYRSRYTGWNVRHFYGRYQGEHQGERSYTWVKSALQKAGAVPVGQLKGAHRKRRERAPLAGMLLHQDGSQHAWVAGQVWDLIVTMDDATSEVYSAFFVEEEGTFSSFRGVREVIEQRGLFCAFYSDRGSHYWLTPEAGGKVDKEHPTQFGRALRHLGIEMIAAYSPEARGRSERMFRTLQDRLPKELTLAGITAMAAANDFLKQRFLPAFNQEFIVAAAEPGSAFVPFIGANLQDILCVQEERTVGGDNCVRYQGKSLQIPATTHRCHYVKARVRVQEYQDGTLAVFHGPRLLARYDQGGQELKPKLKEAA
ncbi:MAG: ISNCY family transposase [Gammaproteobacteria bacterium]